MATRWVSCLALGLMTLASTAPGQSPRISNRAQPSGTTLARTLTSSGVNGAGSGPSSLCLPPSGTFRPPLVIDVPYGYSALWIAPGGWLPVYDPFFPYGEPFFPYGPLVLPIASPDPGFGVAGPLPGPEMAERWKGPPAKKAKRSDPERAGQLVTLGDRLFRAGNPRRAAERYEQAGRADPGAAAPHIGLAQIAMARGDYAGAAGSIREALTAQPGWLIHAPDIREIYGEPAEFAEQIARLESHLQARPSDRDAWLVLGAELYLSGQTKKAADVFLRISDRKADATLETFLDASAAKNQGN